MCMRLDGRGTMRNNWGGCKLLRSGANEQELNGVGIVGPLLSKELKEGLITVSRKSDPVMSIELGFEEMAVNIILCLCSTTGLYREWKRNVLVTYGSRGECDTGW